MMCFRDMTFCSAKCLNTSCPRQFDDEQRAAARKWWKGDGAPIAFSDFSGTCPEYVWEFMTIPTPHPITVKINPWNKDSTTRELANQPGEYFGAAKIERIPPITVMVNSLNPRAWPPCKHCGDGVNCDNYDPDTSAPLWGQNNEPGAEQ